MRVNGLHARGEDQVGACGLALPQVVLERPGIAIEIFVGAELGRVDEDRNDDEIGVVAALPDELRHGRRAGRPWWEPGRSACPRREPCGR